MAGSFLKRVVKEKQLEVERAKKRTSMEKLLHTMLTLPPVRNFREALYRAQRISVIGEVKKKVPGSSSWKPRIQLPKIIKAYEQGGAMAISLVTDEKHFGGKLAQIAEIKKLTSLPVLRKDFIIDTYQIYESRAAQVDALLLIAETLNKKELPRMIEVTAGLGMTPVVEVHTVPDLKRVLRLGADVILINNRDLNTLKINMQTVERLAKLAPRDIMIIAASGYKSAEEVAGISSDRVRAVLMGRALISHKQPESFIQEIITQAEKL
jgi:indole-3-glycerol phosphate synthase